MKRTLSLLLATLFGLLLNTSYANPLSHTDPSRANGHLSLQDFTPPTNLSTPSQSTLVDIGSTSRNIRSYDEPFFDSNHNLSAKESMAEAMRHHELSEAAGVGQLIKHFGRGYEIVETTYGIGKHLVERQKEKWEERKEEREIKDSEHQYKEWRKECRTGCQIPPTHSSNF